MITARSQQTVGLLGSVVVGGVLIGIGVLGIFALYGFVPLLVGVGIVAYSVRHAARIPWVWLLLVALLAAAITVSFMLWGAEHVWANPSCSQHSNQVSGRITYWSGASVNWVCVNGEPVVTHDSR